MTPAHFTVPSVLPAGELAEAEEGQAYPWWYDEDDGEQLADAETAVAVFRVGCGAIAVFLAIAIAIGWAVSQ